MYIAKYYLFDINRGVDRYILNTYLRCIRIHFWIKDVLFMKIETFINNNETVLWKGKPNKAVYIKEQIFSPLLVVALIWLCIDLGFVLGIFGFQGVSMEVVFIVPFFLFHLLPVWIYLFRVFSAFARWKNTEYMVTDQAVYCLTGVFTTSCKRKTFQEITNVSVHQGIFDKRHDVGDIYIITGVTTNSNGKVVNTGFNILDIEDYMRVYKLITETGRDIYADTMYPNDLRPNNNSGYKTQYNPDDK